MKKELHSSVERQSVPMSEAQTSSDFATPIFTIFAGPDRKAFYAHADVLAKAGKFRAVVEGGWKETRDRVIDLTERDEEIVSRLIEYLYTEDYQCPLPPLLVPPPTKTEEESASFESIADSETRPTTPKSYNLRSKTTPAPRTSSTDPPPRFFSPTQTRRRIILQCTQAKLLFNLPHDSAHHQHFLKYLYSPTFDLDQHSFFPPMMFHATLYVLADFILLPDLKSSTLYRLMSLLHFNRLNDDSNGRLSRDRSVATVEVAKFIYANTVKDVACWALSEFIALKLDLLDAEVVKGLVQEGGELVVDVVGFVRAGMGGEWEAENGK